MVMGTRYCVCATGPSSLFRRKRLISSAALFPYAERFARNASELARRGIVCPKVLDVLRIPHIQRDAVHYEPLPGQTSANSTATTRSAAIQSGRNWAS